MLNCLPKFWIPDWSFAETPTLPSSWRPEPEGSHGHLSHRSPYKTHTSLTFYHLTAMSPYQDFHFIANFAKATNGYIDNTVHRFSHHWMISAICASQCATLSFFDARSWSSSSSCLFWAVSLSTKVQSYRGGDFRISVKSWLLNITPDIHAIRCPTLSVSAVSLRFSSLRRLRSRSYFSFRQPMDSSTSVCLWT